MSQRELPAPESDPSKSLASHRFSGWGHFPESAGTRTTPASLSALPPAIRLCRGLGRSYGDASLPVSGDRVAEVTDADRVLAFDPESGLLRAEAGLSLRSIKELFLPRGWFLPVVPGTQDVTLGGMVAADVHGKNHHVVGCIGNAIARIRVQLASGRQLECSVDEEPELFRATLGGMGLTAFILEVEVQMTRVPSPWIWQRTTRHENLAALIGGLLDDSREWPFTVAWADLMPGSTGTRSSFGRGLVISGRWAGREEAPARLPTWRRQWRFPRLPLSSRLLRAANAMYFAKGRVRRAPHVENAERFFFPLDSIAHWSRWYQPTGLTQYQCVIPRRSCDALVGFLEYFVELGGRSYLTVIKDCGAQSDALLSFPLEGLSIALDIPIDKDRARTASLVARLNERLIELGGRVYLAKDAFTTSEHYRAMEARLPTWLAVRDRYDPECRIRSLLAERLCLVHGDR